MSVLGYSRSTRNAINGRLNYDKRSDGKTSGGRSQERSASSRRDVRRVEVDDHPTRREGNTREIDNVRDTKCYRCGDPGHMAADCSKEKDVCYNCKRPGQWPKTAQNRSKMVRVSAMHVNGLVPQVQTVSGEKAPTKTRRTPTTSPPTRSAGSARRPTMGGVSAPNGWSTASPASMRESRRSTTIPLVNSPLTRGTRSEGGHRPTPLGAMTLSWGG